MSDVLGGLARVSHELRSPLNGIICMASLMEDTTLDEEQRELLGVIQSSAQNLAKIIEDLLEISRLQEGKITIERKEFDLKMAAEIAVRNIRSAGLSDTVSFRFDFDEECHVFTGDQVRISEILTNLLSNAVKYTLKGSIVLSIRRDHDYLVIEVEDTGVGIPPEHHTNIFRMFTQLDTSYRSGGSGIGLGLSIVWKLVDLMRGAVHLKSQPGEGSRFTVLLPWLSGNLPPETFHRRVLSTVWKLPPGIRVLVVDDEPVNRFYLNSVLERYKWEITEAKNGREALELALKGDFDIVLMDVSMPDMDGMEATRRLKSQKPLLPVIAVTAHSFSEDTERFLKAGMDRVVLKPIDENELFGALAEFVGGVKG
jgi:CheY-like chemotaxis protein/two-component sensor histidine kinase